MFGKIKGKLKSVFSKSEEVIEEKPEEIVPIEEEETQKQPEETIKTPTPKEDDIVEEQPEELDEEPKKEKKEEQSDETEDEFKETPEEESQKQPDEIVEIPTSSEEIVPKPPAELYEKPENKKTEEQSDESEDDPEETPKEEPQKAPEKTTKDLNEIEDEVQETLKHDNINIPSEEEIKEKIEEDLDKFEKEEEEKELESITKQLEEEPKKKGFFSKFFKKNKEEEPEQELEKVKEIEEEPSEEIKEIKDPEELKTEEEPTIEKSKKEPQITTKELEESEPFEKSEEIEKEPEIIPTPKPQEEPKSEKEKSGFMSKTFKKLKSKKLTEEDFDKIWIELEVFLLEINIAYEIVEKIESHLRKSLIGHSFDRFKLSKKIREVLVEEVSQVLEKREDNFLQKITELNEKGEIARILVLGVNGTGKTTTIAKIVTLLKKNNFSVVVAAADTFRAAAVEQLDEHSEKVGFKLIKHKDGSDPAAVAFDAIEHAKAKNLNVVIVDTAGRMPNNSNLMQELNKIKRVADSQINVFVGDSISGNDLIDQIELFDKVAGISGIILTKTDTDERPGSIVTAAYSIEKPIFYLGIGQGYDDLIKFDAKLIAEKLFEIEEE